MRNVNALAISVLSHHPHVICCTGEFDVVGDCGLLYSSDEVSGSVLFERPLYFSLSLTKFILCSEQSLELIFSYPYHPSISFIVVFTYSLISSSGVSFFTNPLESESFRTSLFISHAILISIRSID